MRLFDDEAVGISRIYTVNRYDFNDSFPAGTRKYYPVDLPTYELIFFLEGESVTHFAGDVINDTENSIRYLPKGITDGEYRVDKISSTVCIDIYFDASSPMPKRALGYKDMPELAPLFIKMYNVWKNGRVGYYAEAMSIFYQIKKELRLCADRYLPNAKAAKILDSYNYMLEHCCEHDFNYKEMCAASGLSYDYFKELFTAHYGMTPVKYVTELRISRAKELLITGRCSITEIAEMCGFENVYYFSTVFKKVTGVPPSQFTSTLR